MDKILSYVTLNPLCTVHEIAEKLNLDPYDVALIALDLIISGEIQTDGISETGLPLLKRKGENRIS